MSKAATTPPGATFKRQEQTLPGLADERLRLLIKRLIPQPLLHDPTEVEAVRMERALRHVLDEMGDVGVLRRATAGERLSGAEEAVFARLAQFMRGELDRLHSELVDRLRREQSTRRARLFSTSKKAVTIYATAVIGLIAAGSVAYLKSWL
jgi:ABC-type Na+ transport system ATPase subunit NatA